MRKDVIIFQAKLVPSMALRSVSVVLGDGRKEAHRDSNLGLSRFRWPLQRLPGNQWIFFTSSHDAGGFESFFFVEACSNGKIEFFVCQSMGRILSTLGSKSCAKELVLMDVDSRK